MQETDKEDEGPRDDGEIGEGGEGDEGEAGQFNSFNWLMLINKVSDRTKMDWDKIWDMNIYEFFNYLQFDIEYKKMEEREMARWRASH